MDALYDRDFFEPYSAQSEAYQEACCFIAREIYRRFAPSSVVDWGCGTALHAGELQRCGARVLGVDGVVADEDLRDSAVELLQADITKPVDLPWKSHDLSLCIDVLEHLHDEDSAAALANIIRGANLVILSCAPPGQGGHHHVNERPRRYWVKRMHELGWHYQRKETGAMESHFLEHRDLLTQSWMYHNLCIYRPEAP